MNRREQGPDCVKEAERSRAPESGRPTQTMSETAGKEQPRCGFSWGWCSRKIAPDCAVGGKPRIESPMALKLRI
eukprot:7418882-Heterocapsa_arctica.AAC.1